MASAFHLLSLHGTTAFRILAFGRRESLTPASQNIRFLSRQSRVLLKRKELLEHWALPHEADLEAECLELHLTPPNQTECPMPQDAACPGHAALPHEADLEAECLGLQPKFPNQTECPMPQDAACPNHAALPHEADLEA